MEYTTSNMWRSHSAVTEPTTRIVVKTKNGWHPIQIYKDKDGKNWVEAKDGTEFGLEIKNNYSGKIMVVSSVDGLNIITGKPAELKNENGYVINGNSKIIIDGWRISNNAVRAFTFSNKKNSYASKLGADISNIGCIGFAFFCEYNYTWNSTYTTPEYYITTSHNTGVPRSLTVENSFSMGTAMGEEKESKVDYVTNSFQVFPYCKQTFYYDSKENLIKNGIIKEKSLPEPFLNDGFCKIV